MEAAVTGSCVLLKKEELGMASLSPTSTRLLAAVKRDGGSHHVIVPIEAAYALLRDEPGSLKLRDASKASDSPPLRAEDLLERAKIRKCTAGEGGDEREDASLFLSRAAVLENAASLGWSIGSGLKFGCDFSLYAINAQESHASSAAFPLLPCPLRLVLLVYLSAGVGLECRSLHLPSV